MLALATTLAMDFAIFVGLCATALILAHTISVLYHTLREIGHDARDAAEREREQ